MKSAWRPLIGVATCANDGVDVHDVDAFRFDAPGAMARGMANNAAGMQYWPVRPECPARQVGAARQRVPSAGAAFRLTTYASIAVISGTSHKHSGFSRSSLIVSAKLMSQSADRTTRGILAA